MTRNVIVKRSELARIVRGTHIKWALIIGAVGSLIGVYFDRNDPCMDSIELFLHASPELNSKIGKVISLTEKGHTLSHASEHSPARMEYRYVVRGAGGVFFVTVHNVSKKCAFSIASIESI
jgi:hypothetical protein